MGYPVQIIKNKEGWVLEVIKIRGSISGDTIDCVFTSLSTWLQNYPVDLEGCWDWTSDFGSLGGKRHPGCTQHSQAQTLPNKLSY